MHSQRQLPAAAAANSNNNSFKLHVQFLASDFNAFNLNDAKVGAKVCGKLVVVAVAVAMSFKLIAVK